MAIKLFFRRDIDLSLIKARELAFCERQEGVRVTYFVLLDTEFYNPFSHASRQILRDIQLCGHAIGLHFDAGSFDGVQALAERVSQECDLLENLIDAPVRVVAWRRPGPGFLGNRDAICGRIHPYQPKFFRDIHYVSDSLGDWTRDRPIDCDAFRDGRAIQVLTHPHIWTMSQHLAQTERIQAVLGQKSEALNWAARANFKTYQPYQSLVLVQGMRV